MDDTGGQNHGSQFSFMAYNLRAQTNHNMAPKIGRYLRKTSIVHQLNGVISKLYKAQTKEME